MDKLTLPARTNSEKYGVAAAHPQAVERLEKGSAPDGECRTWTRATSRGYGVMTINKQTVYAHRLAYWVHRGPVPVGMTVDHLCHNPGCINPNHMQILSMVDNAKRSKRAAQSACSMGHPLSGTNLRVNLDAQGRAHRFCRQCSNRRTAEYRRKNAA